MKHILYILTILLIIKACEQENKTPKPAELPKTVTIYYTANLVPWTETRFIPITPDLFLSTKEKQSVIRLTAPTSLCSFHNMMSSGKPISVQWKFDTWFSAILDYRTYSDTISVYGYYIQCNDAIKVDSNAIFYFIHEIEKVDTSTYNQLEKYYYNDEFYIMDKKQYQNEGGEIYQNGLNERINKLKYIEDLNRD